MEALSYTECPGPDLTRLLAPVELLLRAGPHIGSPEQQHHLGTWHRVGFFRIPKPNCSQPRVAPAIQLSQAPGGWGKCKLQFCFVLFFTYSCEPPKARLTSLSPHLHPPQWAPILRWPRHGQKQEHVWKTHHTGSLHAQSYFRKLREASAMPRDTAWIMLRPDEVPHMPATSCPWPWAAQSQTEAIEISVGWVSPQTQSPEAKLRNEEPSRDL